MDEEDIVDQIDVGNHDEGCTSYVVNHEGSVVELNTLEPCISVNVLSGNHEYQTMRIIGYHGKSSLHILIDSRSTHNFVDIGIADKLELRREPISTQSVTVVDWNNLICTAICK